MANRPRTTANKAPAKKPAAKPRAAKAKAAPKVAKVDVADAKVVQVGDVAGNDAPAAVPPSVDIGAARDSRPTAAGVTATMEPLTAAGVGLTRTVLGLISVSILILTAILAWIEVRGAEQAAHNGEQALAIAASARTGPPDARLALLAVELHRAHDDPAWAMPDASAVEAVALVKDLGADTTLTQAQRDLLVTCVPLPAAAAPKRADTLASCAALADQVLAARQSPGERLKFLADLQKQADEQRQAFRAFWLQVAQLILMNLFFPLLTALLGYIFGTQQRAG